MGVMRYRRMRDETQALDSNANIMADGKQAIV